MRVKLKSLAAESRIIKSEQSLHPGDSDTFRSLYLHRVQVVRLEYRATHLLRMYARWLKDPQWTYDRVEPVVHKNYWWHQAVKKATQMGQRFGVDTSRFKEWIMTP